MFRRNCPAVCSWEFFMGECIRNYVGTESECQEFESFLGGIFFTGAGEV